jgi:outer membrane protein TolC
MEVTIMPNIKKRLLLAALPAGLAALALAPWLAGPAHAAGAAAPGPTPAPTPVPQISAGRTPAPTRSEQVSFPTPTPTPTANPMLQEIIRQGVESADIEGVRPTPARATKDKAMSLKEAVGMAQEAAAASKGTLELNKLNAQRQVTALNSGVNAAIQALATDDRYKELKKEFETYDVMMDEALAAELAMYEGRGYKELNSDERRQLAATRDYGHIQLNMNIAQLDNSAAILDNSQAYMAYAQYSGVAKLQSAIALQQEALDLQKANLDMLRKQYELGAAARVDVEKAEISYEKAGISLNQTKRTLTSTLTSLNKLIGENLGTTYSDFDREQLRPAKATPRLQAYLDDALAQRSEILVAEKNKELTKGQSDLYEDDKPYKLQTVDAQKESALTSEEAAINYDLALANVESEIRAAYKQLLSLRAQIAYNESQVSSAQRSYERISKQRELGFTTQASLDAAGMSVTQAKIQLENSRIDVWLQERKLDVISGIGPGGL